jgi:hypothetical protein
MHPYAKSPRLTSPTSLASSTSSSAEDDEEQEAEGSFVLEVNGGVPDLGHEPHAPPPPAAAEPRGSSDASSASSSSDSFFGVENYADALAEAMETFAASKLPGNTGLVFHGDMLEHHDPNSPAYAPHPESPLRIQIMMQALQQSGLAERMTPLEFAPAENADLLLVHSAAHIDSVNELRDGQLREDRRDQLSRASAFASPGTVDAAYLAAGGVVRAAEAVMQGEVRNAFCLVRPPGHHAEHDGICGFCFFNNVPVATAVAQRRFGAQRVLIVDWDVHHGQGTQHMFYESDSVLYISVHRWHRGAFYVRAPHLARPARALTSRPDAARRA